MEKVFVIERGLFDRLVSAGFPVRWGGRIFWEKSGCLLDYERDGCDGWMVRGSKMPPSRSLRSKRSLPRRLLVSPSRTALNDQGAARSSRRVTMRPSRPSRAPRMRLMLTTHRLASVEATSVSRQPWSRSIASMSARASRQVLSPLMGATQPWPAALACSARTTRQSSPACRGPPGGQARSGA